MKKKNVIQCDINCRVTTFYDHGAAAERDTRIRLTTINRIVDAMQLDDTNYPTQCNSIAGSVSLSGLTKSRVNGN